MVSDIWTLLCSKQNTLAHTRFNTITHIRLFLQPYWLLCATLLHFGKRSIKVFISFIFSFSHFADCRVGSKSTRGTLKLKHVLMWLNANAVIFEVAEWGVILGEAVNCLHKVLNQSSKVRSNSCSCIPFQFLELGGELHDFQFVWLSIKNQLEHLATSWKMFCSKPRSIMFSKQKHC